MTTLEAALQMGVNPRWAIVTRLAYLGPRISVLEKALGKLYRRVTVKSYAKDCAH